MIGMRDLVNIEAYNTAIEYENKICEELKKIGVAYPEAATSNFAYVCSYYFWARFTEDGKNNSMDREHCLRNIGERDGIWQILYNILGSFELLEGYERNIYISLVGNGEGYELPLSLQNVKEN